MGKWNYPCSIRHSRGLLNSNCKYGCTEKKNILFSGSIMQENIGFIVPLKLGGDLCLRKGLQPNRSLLSGLIATWS